MTRGIGTAHVDSLLKSGMSIGLVSLRLPGSMAGAKGKWKPKASEASSRFKSRSKASQWKAKEAEEDEDVSEDHGNETSQ